MLRALRYSLLCNTSNTTLLGIQLELQSMIYIVFMEQATGIEVLSNL